MSESDAFSPGFIQLFPKPDGITNLMTPEEIKKANDASEARASALAAHAAKRRNPTPPDPSPQSFIFNGEAHGTNLVNWQGFTFMAGFVVSQDGEGMPGHAALQTFTSGNYIGSWYWVASGELVGWFERGVDFELTSMDFCPANYNDVSVRFTGKDASGTVVATQDEMCSATTPRNITFTGFTGIRRVEISEFWLASKSLTAGNNGTNSFAGIASINIVS